MFSFVRTGILVSLLTGVLAPGQKPEVSAHGFARLSSGNGYELRAPVRGLEMNIMDSGALEMAPAESGSHSRVRLESYGFGASKTLATFPNIKAAADLAGNQKLVLERQGIQEWFQSSNLGLEQSFRVASRPPTSKAGQLWVKLAVSGDLTPKAIEDGRIELQSEKGSEIYYTGLKAWDAKGQALDARMEVIDNSIQISVDEKAAQYPVTIDPTWGQQDRLAVGEYNYQASNGFGVATAISGDTAAVGGGGIVKVFVRSQGIWELQQRLSVADSSTYRSFGDAIALSGDTLVIGARFAYIGSSIQYSGMAYVYTRAGNTWTLSQTIPAVEAHQWGRFGQSVALQGNTLVIGSYGQKAGSVDAVGAVYVFTLSAGSWVKTAKILSPTVVLNESFGINLSMSGNRMAIGSDQNKTHVFAFSNLKWRLEQTIPLEGEVSLLNDRLMIRNVLYRLQSGVWTEETTFPGSTESTNALVSDLVAIGKPYSFPAQPGSITLFRYTNGAWVAGATLAASDGVAGDYFGSGIALEGSTLIAGAPYAKDMRGDRVGKAYAFYQGNSRMVFNKTFLRSGETATGQIFILTAAPTGGLTIPLQNTNPKLTVPSQVVIPAGGKHVNFNVIATKLVNSPDEATITATVGNETLKSPLLLDSFIKSVEVSIPGYGSVGPSDLQGKVNLNVPAPAAGGIVTLTSSNSAVLKVPNKVVVPATWTSQSFTGSVYQVTEATPVTVTATYGGTAVTTQITINPNLDRVQLSPITVARDSTTKGTVYVRVASTSDAVITLSSSRPSVVVVPPTVILPANSRSVTFSMEVAPGTTSTPVTISATYLGATKTAELAVINQYAIGLSIGPKKVQGGSGNSVSITVYLAAPAGHGGADVSITSSDPTLAPVTPMVHIPEGQQTITTFCTPLAVSSDTTITIGAQYGTRRTVTRPFTITH